MNTFEVKAFFEKTDVYQTFNYNLKIRTETVGHFIRGMHFDNVLDMPCGTGDISAPFLDQFNHLTMMDFSANMIQIARDKISLENRKKVTFIHSDFYRHTFDDEHFDLLINIGILAHIDEPFNFLNRSLKLIKPGGFLLIQNTDSEHWFARLIHVYLSFRRLIGKDKYRLNKISKRELIHCLEKSGFEKIGCFQYNQSFLGLSRLFSNTLKYKMTRWFFGYAGRNKRAKSGSDATFLFRKNH